MIKANIFSHSAVTTGWWSKMIGQNHSLLQRVAKLAEQRSMHVGNIYLFFFTSNAPMQLSSCKHFRWHKLKLSIWRHEHQWCGDITFHVFISSFTAFWGQWHFGGQRVFWRPNAPYGLRPWFLGSKGPLGIVMLIFMALMSNHPTPAWCGNTPWTKAFQKCGELGKQGIDIHTARLDVRNLSVNVLNGVPWFNATEMPRLPATRTVQWAGNQINSPLAWSSDPSTRMGLMQAPADWRLGPPSVGNLQLMTLTRPWLALRASFSKPW